MSDLEKLLLEFNWIKDSNTIRTTYNRRYLFTSLVTFTILYSIILKNNRYYIYTHNEDCSQKFGKKIYHTSITTVEEYLDYFKDDVEEIRKYKLRLCMECT